MLRLHALGWGVRRIATELGCSPMTVRRYLETGGWAPAKVPERPKALDGLESWLAERFRRHRGNADVVRQDLQREHGIRVGLRTVEHADGLVDVDTNRYSVPWRRIGTAVTVRVSDGQVHVFQAGTEVARHAERRGRRERVIEADHRVGLLSASASPIAAAPAELLRPVSEYEQVIGGGW